MDFGESITPAGAERKELIEGGEHHGIRLGEEALGVKRLFFSLDGASQADYHITWFGYLHWGWKDQ